MGKTPATSKNFRIVTLCGSRGALSAYIQILNVMPVKSGMAFVVLIHRRDHSSHELVEILSAATKMPVEEIENGCILQANHVYVMPAQKDLTTNGTVFQLVPMSTLHGWPDGFDIFLSSLAKNTKNRAVTVILSGMGGDGSESLGALRRNGGLAFAQSDAKANSMPRNAVATGNIDHFCSAADIGALISDLPAVIAFTD